MTDTFLGKDFQRNYIITMGCQFNFAYISLSSFKNPIQMQIWDLAGQSRFNKVRKEYYAGAHVAIVVGDLTKPATFKTIPIWISEILENSRALVPILLVGNKLDLVKNNSKGLNREKINYLLNLNERKVDLADQSLIYLSTSAKDGFNVTELFQLALIEALIWDAKKLYDN